MLLIGILCFIPEMKYKRAIHCSPKVGFFSFLRSLQARVLPPGVGSLVFLQGIFPTQGLNPHLPQCRWILYQLSHKQSPRILAWLAYPFSSGSSQPRNQMESPALQVDSLPTELSGKPRYND